MKDKQDKLQNMHSNIKPPTMLYQFFKHRGAIEFQFSLSPSFTHRHL